jgi:putative ubiquitin-RnfH superfamily antitoxin RatB of RatAB toxin-antitoxin module
MARLRVEVVYARAHAQHSRVLELEAGVSAGEAVRRSGLLDVEGAPQPSRLRLGIGGQPVAHGRLLADGERVEILRPLLLDPKEARRRRARRPGTRC